MLARSVVARWGRKDLEWFGPPERKTLRPLEVCVLVLLFVGEGEEDCELLRLAELPLAYLSLSFSSESCPLRMPPLL